MVCHWVFGFLIPPNIQGLIDYPNFLARLLGNSIWCIAVVYYIYITFLGYTGLFRVDKFDQEHRSLPALPILKNTHVFLYPITFLFIFFVATISAGWNISQTGFKSK
jgi:hypothetical protein